MKCENMMGKRSGMIGKEKTTEKSSAIKALSLFAHACVGNTSPELPSTGNEDLRAQTDRSEIERWQHRLAEQLRHNTYR